MHAFAGVTVSARRCFYICRLPSVDRPLSILFCASDIKGCSPRFGVAVPCFRPLPVSHLSFHVSHIVNRHAQVVPKLLSLSRLRDFIGGFLRCRAPSLIPQYSDVRRRHWHLSLVPRQLSGRSLLEEQILCNADYQKYAFKMDRIAIALYLDMALRIDSAVDILSVSSSNRRSLQALMDGMGGESTLHRPNVEALFFSNKPGPVSNSDLVQQAWAACHVAILPHMAMRLHALVRIRTNTIPDGVCATGQI
ncbi:hypothetical protein EDD16DRAFT_28177 [Pisolithus croceorrhizus]|nr:hypothetical protein EDD16DRAFT_28177 [Pisolithus croceorrhizus]